MEKLGDHDDISGFDYPTKVRMILPKTRHDCDLRVRGKRANIGGYIIEEPCFSNIWKYVALEARPPKSKSNSHHAWLTSANGNWFLSPNLLILLFAIHSLGSHKSSLLMEALIDNNWFAAVQLARSRLAKNRDPIPITQVYINGKYAYSSIWSCQKRPICLALFWLPWHLLTCNQQMQIHPNSTLEIFSLLGWGEKVSVWHTKKYIALSLSCSSRKLVLFLASIAVILLHSFSEFWANFLPTYLVLGPQTQYNQGTWEVQK